MQTTTPTSLRRTPARAEIRPLAPADRDGLADAFRRLSEDTRRRRFRGLARPLGERDLDRLTRARAAERRAA